ncbi:MAG: FHA domain-containing protein [Myxococcota bacterium]
MYKLQIRDDEGRTTPVPLLRDEVTIGRKEGNTIRLTERNVSRRHARIVKDDGRVVIDDLSRYGTRINGRRISGPTPLDSGDILQIGDYELTLDVDEQAAADKAHAPKAKEDSTAVVHVGRGLAEQAAGPPRLVALTTNLAGSEYELRGDEIVVGRTDESDVVVDHRSISRRHARIYRDDDGNWAVEDLGSANGIRVNGEDYEKTVLRKGDVLELGHVELRWVTPGESFSYEPGMAGEAAGGGRSAKGLLILVALVLVAGGALFAYQQYFSKPLDETGVGQAEPEKVPAAEESGEGGAGAEEAVDLEALVEEAETAAEAERWDDAIAAWGEVLDVDAEHEAALEGIETAKAEKETAALYKRLADLVNDGEVEEAWAEIEELGAIPEESAYRARAVELEKAITAGYVSELLEQGRAAIEEERWDDARTVADRVLEIDPDHEGAKSLKESAERGEAAAEKAAAKAAAKKPEPRRARPEPREARPEPKPKPEDEPEPKPKAAAKSGKELYREARRLQSKDPSEALSLYKQAASKGYVRAWRQMGSIYIQQGKQSAAIEAYKKYLSLSPGAADAEVIRNTIIRLGGQP